MKYLSYKPRAQQENVILRGNARFTLLTNRMVRMEWHDNGEFVDTETLAVVNRNMPAVLHKVKTVNERVIIDTKEMVITYTNTGLPFSSKNLSISFKMNGQPVNWQPGKKDPHNLKGTLRTLDGMDADKHVFGFHGPETGGEPRKVPVKLPDGLISRSGWAVFDDSSSVVIDNPGGNREWIKAPVRFAYGMSWFPIYIAK